MFSSGFRVYFKVWEEYGAKAPQCIVGNGEGNGNYCAIPDLCSTWRVVGNGGMEA